jgi:hypothetical protein
MPLGFGLGIKNKFNPAKPVGNIGHPARYHSSAMKAIIKTAIIV